MAFCHGTIVMILTHLQVLLSTMLTVMVSPLLMIVMIRTSKYNTNIQDADCDGVPTTDDCDDADPTLLH